MSVSEQEEGGGTGDLGSNTPSSKASALPPTPSSLNQTGLEVRAGGRSHRDRPAQLSSLTQEETEAKRC